MHLVWKELKDEPKFKSGNELENNPNDDKKETPGRKAAKRARDQENLQKEELQVQKRVADALDQKNNLFEKKNALLEKRQKHKFFTDPLCPAHLSERYFEEQAALYFAEPIEEVNDSEPEEAENVEAQV